MPLHRSLTLWFGLLGLLFLVFAWIDSMSHVTSMEIRVPTHTLYLDNGNSTLNASLRDNAGTGHSTTAWHLWLHPRRAEPGREWFPLPSYLGFPGAWHHFNFPYGFLLAAYLGLWQLPWLWRYHRRRHIDRRQTP